MPPKRDPNSGDGNNPGKYKGQKFKQPHQQQQQDYKGQDAGDRANPKKEQSAGNPNAGAGSRNSSAELGQKFYSQMNINPPQWQQQERPKKPPPQQNQSSRPQQGQNNSKPQQGGSSKPQQLAKDGISSDQVQSVLECPVCFEVPKPPIFNCQTGHIICGGCRARVRECPLCRQGYSDSRNYVAEKLAESCTFKCPFQDQGCEAMIKLADEDRHVNECNFRPLGCEVFPCKTSEVAYTEFIPHMKNNHRSQFGPNNHWKVSREVFVKKLDKLMQRGYRPPYVLNCHGNTFLQYTQCVGEKMWFWVSLLGTPEEASRYKVTLALFAKDKDLKNTWVGPVHSVRHSGDDIYFNGLCMVTTEECLKSFFWAHAAEGFPCYSLEILIEKVR